MSNAEASSRLDPEGASNIDNAAETRSNKRSAKHDDDIKQQIEFNNNNNNKKYRATMDESQDEENNNNTGSNDTQKQRPSSSEGASLGEIVVKINDLISKNQPRYIYGVPTNLHPLPPFVCKNDWSKLGDALRVAEKPTSSTNISGDKWISLRCDGNGFSKLTKRLRRENVFSQAKDGYMEQFASIMIKCLSNLMLKFPSAKCGYTQSDEITVLIPPASIVRGERQCHIYGGRIQKICSIGASTVTSTFVTELMALLLCHQQKSNENENQNQNDDEKDTESKKKKDLLLLQDIGLPLLQQVIPTFDCRIGSFSSYEEAISLILWRAYDCGINATSDAVYKSGLPGSKNVIKQSTDHRLKWLHKHNLLPQQPHQREGTFLSKRKRRFSGINQKTNQPVTYLRSKIEQVHGCIIQLYKDGNLLPPDDKLEEEAKEQQQVQPSKP